MGGAGATDDSNLCLLCHQGRESKVSINTKIATDADGVMSFTNVHYYAAAATLFGTQVKGGYEYTGLAPMLARTRSAATAASLTSACSVIWAVTA